jgi:hypothetical protein
MSKIFLICSTTREVLKREVCTETRKKNNLKKLLNETNSSLSFKKEVF